MVKLFLIIFVPLYILILTAQSLTPSTFYYNNTSYSIDWFMVKMIAVLIASMTAFINWDFDLYGEMKVKGGDKK